ncbi:hypothetical protein KY289_036543 [Solanum tuberosum]|nr:hypothetical protein KY289_036543 [Solanum tuberosum]
MKCHVDEKTRALEALIKQNYSELMKAIGAKDNKSDKSHVPIEEIVHNKKVEDAGHEPPQSDTKILSGNEDVADTIQQDFEKYASNPDSTTSASISSGTEAVIDTLVYRLSNEPIHVESLSVIISLQLTGSDIFYLTAIPIQLPVKESAHNLDTKTPAPRNIMPSKIMQSPYLTAFGSSDKARGKYTMTHAIHLKDVASPIKFRQF